MTTNIAVTNSGTGAYLIDGSEIPNPTITLIRGNTYNLVISATGHPFWITTISGAYNSNNVYNPGSSLVNNGTQDGTITFVVPNDAPNTLYYVCQNHSVMRGTIVIINPSQNVVCYKKGTLILTNQGLIPIEKIKVGDNVITSGKIYNKKFIEQYTNPQPEPVIWIGNFKVEHLDMDSRPICIKKSTFGENSPFQDLYVSPKHCLLLDEMTVGASHLINGNTIYRDMECTSVEYYHLECKAHYGIFANGVLAETYIDLNNRYVFDKF